MQSTLNGTIQLPAKPLHGGDAPSSKSGEIPFAQFGSAAMSTAEPVTNS